MAGKKAAGENTKKASGNAKKVETPTAEAAAQKQAAENAKKSKSEEEEWSKGAKSSSKKYEAPLRHNYRVIRWLPDAHKDPLRPREAAEAKKVDAARKKAERDALLAEEETAAKAAKASAPKTATKKSRGTLDLSALDADADPSSAATKPSALNASGIDNALDALSLTKDATADKVDRHPERRFKAAYAAYEARRLPELEEEMKGLRRQQRIDLVRKEFEKSPENPFNQANAKYDSTRQEIGDIRVTEREKIEARLTAER
ncbi:MAG: hypothetical protein M1833_000674 [Piccolia ochrophora]|nr:MAG: hypothetical protein M1833_000674 [Piccolia ochrophora]